MGATGVPEGFLCGGCRERRPSFERLHFAWIYQPPLDGVILALKFRRLRYLAWHLAEGIAEHLGEVVERCDCVVPVPLHWGRRWNRGFDQAREIADPLAVATGLPLRLALARRRATVPQSSLDRKNRLVSMRGAFRGCWYRPLSARGIEGRTVLLVDDVVTTSATLEAAASCLRAMGAARVIAVAAARTPGPGEPLVEPMSLSGDGGVADG